MYTEDSRGRLVPLLPGHDYGARQQLPKVYALNGAVYVTNTRSLKAHRSFVIGETLAWHMPRARAVDIDSALDFRFAGLLLGESNDT
jgi:CMP-N,N'-diacetyllegionaminic acid synthase